MSDEIPQALLPTEQPTPVAPEVPQEQPQIEPQFNPKVEAHAYDISGPEPVLGAIPHNELQSAIMSGKYSLPQGQDVTVISPDGEFGTLPSHEAEDAFHNGYSYATPEMVDAHLKHEKYSTTGQQIITGLEGAGEGALGFVAPGIERALGVKPEDIAGRKEENPWIHGSAEAAGFGASMYFGVGEARALTMAGEALAHGAEAVNVSSKVAQGALKMAAEMGVMQGSDEVTNHILNTPNSAGTAWSNVGMSSLLGGAMGGTFAGLGKLGGKAVDKVQTSEFLNRMKYRLTGAAPEEALVAEASNLVKTAEGLGDEVWGATGLKSQVIRKSLPEMNEKMIQSFESLDSTVLDAVEALRKKGTSERMLSNVLEDYEKVQATITKPGVTSSEAFDAVQTFKNDLWSYSKGKFGEEVLPKYHEAYDLISTTKALGSQVKNMLENPKIWGEAAGFQKSINGAIHEFLPSLKDFRSKFMTKVGGEFQIDPAKFQTYLNQNGKATTETIRQQMMGNFISGAEKYVNAVEKAYEKIGAVNPNPIPGLGALKESLNKQSIGAKTADALYHKLYNSGGLGIGSSAGAALGDMTGIPGGLVAGVWLGGKVGEKLISTILKPAMEKAVNSEALQQAIKFGEASIKGQNQLQKNVTNLFKGTAYPASKHLYEKDVEKLDKQVNALYNDPQKMMQVTGNLGHYMDGHASEVASLSTRAVNYLHSLKPVITPQNVMDTPREPTKAEMAPYYRQLAIANDPTLVLDHIKNGTLLPQDILTIKTISPAYYDQMAAEMTKQVADKIHNDEIMPYKTKLSLSMFLGQPLDSTMNPDSIQAIQGGFALKQQKQQQEAQSSTHKGTTSLNKSPKSYMTPNQAAAADRTARE